MKHGSIEAAGRTRATSPAQLLALQRAAGNAAVASVLQPSSRLPTVSRCGPTNPDCGCSEEQEVQAAGGVVQRGDIFDSFKSAPAGDPLGLLGPPKQQDRLRFS